MSETLVGLDRLPQPLREPITQYCQTLRGLHAGNALSLTLFGSIVVGGFDADRELVRNVFVLERIDLDALRDLARRGRTFARQRIAAPLIMTPAYIKASLDTFPLEMLEIGQQHVTVFGPQHFHELPIEKSHVRLQSERELKSILIGLRQGLLAAAGKEKRFGALEQTIGEALLRALRGMLFLKDAAAPASAAQTVAAIEKLAERELPGARDAVDPCAAHHWEQFRTLYDDVEFLGGRIDAW